MSIATILLAVLTLASGPPRTGAPQAAPAPRADGVREFFEHLRDRFSHRDLPGLLALYRQDYEGDYGLVTRSSLEAGLARLFRRYPFTAYELEIRRVRLEEEFATALVSSRLRYGPDPGDSTAAEEETLWVLRPLPSGTLQAWKRFTVDGDAQERFRQGRYRSPCAGFEVACPPGWVLFVPRRAPSELVFDLVWMVRPASGSIAGIAVVDLPPRPVSARHLAWIENLDIEGGRSGGAEVTGFGPVKLAGLEAWETRIVDHAGGGDRRIRRLSLVRGRLYYTVYLQGEDGERFDADREGFDAILASLAVHDDASPERSGRLQEGRFRFEDLGCEIEAPAGWKLAPTASRYLFRAVAIPPGDGTESLVQFFARRVHTAHPARRPPLEATLDSIVASLRDCVPGARPVGQARDVVVRGLKGREIDLDIPASSLARTRKVAVFLRKGVLYVFYCDAIPPETYEGLEPAFERIVGSLSFR